MRCVSIVSVRQTCHKTLNSKSLIKLNNKLSLSDEYDVVYCCQWANRRERKSTIEFQLICTVHRGRIHLLVVYGWWWSFFPIYQLSFLPFNHHHHRSLLSLSLLPCSLWVRACVQAFFFALSNVNISTFMAHLIQLINEIISKPLYAREARMHTHHWEKSSHQTWKCW